MTNSARRSPPSAPGPAAELGALCCVIGLLGVGHGLLWTRRLLDLLGTSGDAVALVFGTLILGNAVGAGLVPRRVSGRTAASLWQAVAACQLLSGLLALPLLLSVRLSDRLWPLLGPELVTHPAAALLRAAAALVLVLLPAVASGATLPFLFGAAFGPSRPMPRWGPVLYGINTLGALISVWLIPFVLLPRLGTLRSGFVMVGGNLLVCGVCVWLGRRPGSSRPTAAVAAGREASPPHAGHLGSVFGTGFLVMALEILALHQFSQVLISSLHSTAAVVGTVLLALGVSALVSHRVPKRPTVMLAFLCAAGIVVLAEPFLFCLFTKGLVPFPPFSGAGPYTRRAARS